LHERASILLSMYTAWIFKCLFRLKIA
jgi:hypothetical protein